METARLSIHFWKLTWTSYFFSCNTVTSVWSVWLLWNLNQSASIWLAVNMTVVSSLHQSDVSEVFMFLFFFHLFLVVISVVLMVCNLNQSRAVNSGMTTNLSAYFVVAVFVCWLGRFSFSGLWDFHHPSRAEQQQQQQQWVKKVTIMFSHTFCFLRQLCSRTFSCSDGCSVPNPPLWTSYSAQHSLLSWFLYLTFKERPPFIHSNTVYRLKSLVFYSSRFNFLSMEFATWFPDRLPLGFQGNVYACEHTTVTSQVDIEDD